MIAVEQRAAEIARSLEARRNGLCDPGRWHNLGFFPCPVIEHKLANLRCVAWTQEKASRGRDFAVARIGFPFEVADAKRMKQHFVGEGGQRLAGDAFEEVTQQVGTSTVINPYLIRWCDDPFG